MKSTLTSLLTLLIVIIGLAMIVGGSGAVRFLFAPFISEIQTVARWLFVILIVIILVVASFHGKKSTPRQVRNMDATSSQGEVATTHNGEVRNGH